MRIPPRFGTACFAAVSLLVATEARASHVGKHDADTIAREADAQPGASGASAAVDKNGKLRAITAEEAKALLDAMAPYISQSSEGLTPVHHQSGAISIDLQDRFQSVSVARVATDGSPVVRCVTTRAEAEQFLAKDSTRSGKASTKKTRATKPAVPPPALRPRR